MERALKELRLLQAEAPETGSDYNKGFFAALSELEERFLDIMWEEGEEDGQTY